MANMSYCRHENTANDLFDVWAQWEDYTEGTSVYEDKGRRRIIRLVEEMYDQFKWEGLYDD